MENKKIPIYKIVFEDNSIFEGGHNLFNTKWMEIPNKKIKKLLYRLPAGDYLCMGGYEEYFHRVEALTDISGKEKGKTKLQSIFLYGKKDKKVVVYQIGLMKGINLGLIYKKIVNIEDEQIKKLNRNNWKRGGVKNG